MAIAQREFAINRMVKLGASANRITDTAESSKPISREGRRPIVSATAPVGTSETAMVSQNAMSNSVTWVRLMP